MVDLKKKPFCLNENELKWVENTLKGMSQEEKIRAMILGKVRITPFRVLTCLLFFASLIMTLATAIWFLFFYLK